MSPDAALRHFVAPPANCSSPESGDTTTAQPVPTVRLEVRRSPNAKTRAVALLRLLVVLAAHGAALAAFFGGPTQVPELPTQAIEVSLVAPAAPAPLAEPAALPPPKPAAKPTSPAPTPPPEPIAKPQAPPVVKPAPRPAPKPPRPAPETPKTAISPPQPAEEAAPTITAQTARTPPADKPAAKASEHTAVNRGTPAPVSRARFDAAYLDNPRPVYPRVSRRTGEQGRVLLRVRVEASGAPSDVQLHTSSGSARLDKAALTAVNRWRFEPAKRGDLAIASWIVVPIDFKLEGS